MNNLIGQKFNRLTVLKYLGKDKYRKIICLCKCDCGKEITTREESLIKASTKSCGCVQKEKAKQRLIDLAGQRFGRLLVLSRADNSNSGVTQWNCRCDCGKNVIVRGVSLTRELTRSCGCLRIEKCRTNTNCWTAEETGILKQFYPENGSGYCSSLLNRTRGSIIQMAIILNLKYGIEWTKEEDDILKQFYCSEGSDCFSRLPNRKKYNIMRRAKRLNLKVNFAPVSGLLKKIIIKKLSKTKVISTCVVHGETEHYYHNNKIHQCLMCKCIRNKEYGKCPINNFTMRLRSSIKRAFKRIYDQNGGHKKVGAMRYLDYSDKELYNYLENIKKLQENKCPHCNTSYDKCKISIDHVIPVSRAKTEQEVIDLFDLKNLNLMCKNCNSQKWKHEYNSWRSTRCH